MSLHATGKRRAGRQHPRMSCEEGNADIDFMSTRPWCVQGKSRSGDQCSRPMRSARANGSAGIVISPKMSRAGSGLGNLKLEAWPGGIVRSGPPTRHGCWRSCLESLSVIVNIPVAGSRSRVLPLSGSKVRMQAE